MRLYHGSPHPLHPGTVLVPMAGYEGRWGDCGFFRILEKGRPPWQAGHTKSVFLCERPDDIDPCGGNPGNILVVDAPSHLVTRHDQQWSSLITCLDEDPDFDPGIRMEEAVRLYWTGEPSGDPLWEYLAPYAVVAGTLP